MISFGRTIRQYQLYTVRRSYWIDVIERLWREKSVAWLSGVRRVGKTFLCQSLSDVEYVDCELPSTRSRSEAPELFLRDVAGRRGVVDEIQRLRNPSELLKIAYHPETRLIAIGRRPSAPRDGLATHSLIASAIFA